LAASAIARVIPHHAGKQLLWCTLWDTGESCRKVKATQADMADAFSAAKLGGHFSFSSQMNIAKNLVSTGAQVASRQHHRCRRRALRIDNPGFALNLPGAGRPGAGLMRRTALPRPAAPSRSLSRHQRPAAVHQRNSDTSRLDRGFCDHEGRALVPPGERPRTRSANRYHRVVAARLLVPVEFALDPPETDARAPAQVTLRGAEG
jgi:hypothetical protein